MGKFKDEGWRVRKDGSQFWANVVIDPIRDDDGRLVGVAKITRDVTERKAAQEAVTFGKPAMQTVNAKRCPSRLMVG